jgi:hypothetical protein
MDVPRRAQGEDIPDDYIAHPAKAKNLKPILMPVRTGF